LAFFNAAFTWTEAAADCAVAGMTAAPSAGAAARPVSIVRRESSCVFEMLVILFPSIRFPWRVKDSGENPMGEGVPARLRIVGEESATRAMVRQTCANCRLCCGALLPPC
jgi:hypothetical protein